MSIKLNSTSGGSVSLDPVSSLASDITLTLPDSVGSAGQFLKNSGTAGSLEFADGGKILKVVQESTSTTVLVGTTTYTDTDLSASITPASESSRILVIVNQTFECARTVSGKGAGIRLLSGSTIIHDPLADATGPYEFYEQDGFYDRATIVKLDSPATTSAITYKTQGRPYTTADTGVVRFQTSGAVTDSTSYITLIEVAA